MVDQSGRLQHPRLVLAGSRFFCEAFAALLERSGATETEIVGAGLATDAERLVRERSADVLMMELEPKHGGALDAIAALVGSPPAARIVLLCHACDRERALAGIRAGADACVLVEEGMAEAKAALDAVREGRRYVSALVSDLLMRQGMRPEGLTGAAQTLTPREREILGMLATGMSGPQIATTLGLSARTVHVHRSRIMRKLGTHNVAQLIRRALELDLIKLGLVVHLAASASMVMS
jgi:two-component system nitrate/nitrite response regulator NarL